MIILLSPAKTLDFETPVSFSGYTVPVFMSESEGLVSRLRTLSPQDLSALMGLSDRLAVLNSARYASWSADVSLQNARQAVFAFDGDVYEALDGKSLSPDDLAFAQQHLRILSGLYGILRPLDLIMPHRLEMGTRLANARGDDLYAFWGERLANAIRADLSVHAGQVLVNLASEEYFRSVGGLLPGVPVIQPVFEDWRAGKFKVVSFYAKRARGMMARFAVRNRIVGPELLRNFDGGGYVFCPECSSATRWVFRRTSVREDNS